MLRDAVSHVTRVRPTRIVRRLCVAALAFAVFWGSSTRDAVAQGSAALDRAALEALYDATDGPNWTNSTNWKTDAPLDQWHGVRMHEGRVWGVDLHENALAGAIPSDLGSLTNIRWLHLSSNALTGTIPTELGDLRNLSSLTLWGNELTGPIPTELGNLRNLQILYLAINELTGPIPTELGNLTNLEHLHLQGNELTGPIPTELGNLRNLKSLWLQRNDLTGSTAWLANLTNLETLNLSANWGVTGTLPRSLQAENLEELDIWFTQTCAPAAWREWLQNIEFDGRLCGAGNVTIDVAVVYTPAAREAAGGTAAIGALIDLWIAETNGAYDASGVQHRVALAAREEVNYVESGDDQVDLRRLSDPADGHMDEVHRLRDRAGADLVHLIMGEPYGGGRGEQPGAFSYCSANYPTSSCFAHELGHNMALYHDRYQESEHSKEEGVKRLFAHPAYGYVNQRAFEAGAPVSSRWQTIMAYFTQCDDAALRCNKLFRFSNPRQQYDGDPLGVPQQPGKSGVDGPADAVAVLNATGPAVALWRDPPGANSPPEPVGTLSPLQVGLGAAAVTVDVSGAFRDPDGDALAYGATSSAAQVATVSVSGSRVMVRPHAEGTATIRVTATDPGGLSATQSFRASVGRAGSGRGFTDDPLRRGVTPVRAVHFTELRSRIDALREAAGLGRFRWTDPALRAGVTPIRLVHLTELRTALAAAYRAAGRSVPRWTDPAPARGTTPIRAVHLTELRSAVVALE